MENFRLVTPVERVDRKDMNLADRTLIVPSNANPLLDGEWLEYDAAKKAIRAGGNTLAWAVWAERGRSDTQALGKAPVLYMGTYEADTLIFDAAALAHGDPLMIDDVTIGTLTKSGLMKHGGGAQLVIGYVTRLPAINGAKLLHMEDNIGSLEVGKLADLIVVNQNIMEIEPNQIHQTQVLMTMMDGKVWHDVVFGWGDSKDDVVPDVDGLLPSPVPDGVLSH